MRKTGGLCDSSTNEREASSKKHKIFPEKILQPQILKWSCTLGWAAKTRQVSVSYLLLPTQEFHAQTCPAFSKFELKNLVFF